MDMMSEHWFWAKLVHFVIWLSYNNSSYSWHPLDLIWRICFLIFRWQSHLSLAVDNIFSTLTTCLLNVKTKQFACWRVQVWVFQNPPTLPMHIWRWIHKTCERLLNDQILSVSNGQIFLILSDCVVALSKIMHSSQYLSPTSSIK